MKLEFELKPTDILLLKVLSCILIAVLTLNLFIFPGLNKQADLSAQKEETRQEKQQVEEAIASMPATKARIDQQQSDLTELSEDYYPQMENNNVDELVTGIALAHGLFPAALSIEDSVPGGPAAYGVTGDTRDTTVELIKKLGSRAKLIHQKDMGKSADPINLIEGVTDLTRENYCEKIFGRTNPTDICTVGTGIMDIPEIVKTVTELDYAPYIIVELDCCARQTEEEYNTPLSPLASIKASREYLESVIG